MYGIKGYDLRLNAGLYFFSLSTYHIPTKTATKSMDVRKLIFNTGRT
jgi:hypothetical protein